jgi:hypothetical protein
LGLSASPARLQGAHVLTLASLAGGLSPFLAVNATAALHTGPGFAIAISATSSATLVAASLLAILFGAAGVVRFSAARSTPVSTAKRVSRLELASTA